MGTRVDRKGVISFCIETKKLMLQGSTDGYMHWKVRVSPFSKFQIEVESDKTNRKALGNYFPETRANVLKVVAGRAVINLEEMAYFQMLQPDTGYVFQVILSLRFNNRDNYLNFPFLKLERKGEFAGKAGPIDPDIEIKMCQTMAFSNDEIRKRHGEVSSTSNAWQGQVLIAQVDFDGRGTQEV